MDEQPKSSFDWKRSLITVAILLVTAGVVGGTVWYIMDQNAKDVAASNAKSEAALQKQIDELNAKETSTPKIVSGTSASVAQVSSTNLSDADNLNVLTINKTGWIKGTSYVAPAIKAKDANWAVTVPVPVNFSQNDGYTIPGMGGVTYVWHKVDGTWTYVGQGGENGFDDAVNAVLSQIPTSIIPR